MTICICYGAWHYEGYSKPLIILPTVDEAKAWWAEQARLYHRHKEPNYGYYDTYFISELADDGRIYDYRRQPYGALKNWLIDETREPANAQA